MTLRHNESTGFLILCSLSIFISYFIYGILQEKITKTTYGPQKEEFTCISSMLFIQCFINVVAACMALSIWPEEKSAVPNKNYALCGLSYIGAMFSSNFSLRFVNYPTQVVGKSIKPIPVMLLSVVLARKRYPLQKYFFVVMITIGVILFMYKGKSVGKSDAFSFGWGEALLLLSLALDGLTGGMQEKLRSRSKVGPYTLMCNFNMWSLFYLGFAILFTGQATEFIGFVCKYPIVLVYIFTFGVVSAVGQMFIYVMIVNFGPLMCSIVTTTRKFFAVLASVILFGHNLSNQQMVGASLVFAGLMADQVFGKASKPPAGTVTTTTAVADKDEHPKEE